MSTSIAAVAAAEPPSVMVGSFVKRTKSSPTGETLMQRSKRLYVLEGSPVVSLVKFILLWGIQAKWPSSKDS